MRYSKDFAPLNTNFNLRATILFAVLGGSGRKMLSPAIALKSATDMICCFSNSPSLINSMSFAMYSFIASGSVNYDFSLTFLIG